MALSDLPEGRAMDVTIESLKKERTYSEELGIELKGADDREVFKWFLASVLFGARISETIAKRTYRAFERHDLLTPERILEAGWDFLVNPVMREGGYVRYDEKTSREVLRNCEMLMEGYGGSLRQAAPGVSGPQGPGDEAAPFLWGRPGDREHIPEGTEALLDKGGP